MSIPTKLDNDRHFDGLLGMAVREWQRYYNTQHLPPPPRAEPGGV